MTTYLDDLVAGAYRRVSAAEQVMSGAAIRQQALSTPRPPSFHAALSGDDVAVIAEIKRASPSKGPLAPDLDATNQAQRYLKGGAAAISVLTEPEQFHGSLEDLAGVAQLGAVALRKDFIVDEYQLFEARAAGAAAVLLIAAALDAHTLTALHTSALHIGLDVLVEVHDDEEVARALDAGARIVGVNARDLKTFALDRNAFERVASQLPPEVLTVAESGVRDPDDVARYAQAGADAVLVGESLVTATDPTDAVAALVAAGRREAPTGATR